MNRRATHITSRRETRAYRAAIRARVLHAGLVAACLALISAEVYWALLIASQTGH